MSFSSYLFSIIVFTLFSFQGTYFVYWFWHLFRCLVEMRRIELLTPCLQGRCSPSWATPPNFIHLFVSFGSPYTWYCLRLASSTRIKIPLLRFSFYPSPDKLGFFSLVFFIQALLFAIACKFHAGCAFLRLPVNLCRLCVWVSAAYMWYARKR